MTAPDLKAISKEWRNLASVCYVKALSGDTSALELMRDAILEAADFFDKTEIVDSQAKN